LDSNAIVGHMPNLLQQIDISSLDLGDILGTIIGSIALIVTAVTFYISHTQASQSEQLKIFKDIWAEITKRQRTYSEKKMEYLQKKSEKPDEAKPRDEIQALSDSLGATLSLAREIDYLAYYIVRGEIKDKFILDFYRPDLTHLIKFLSIGDVKFGENFPNIRKLIIKWRIDVTISKSG
jgi:hypothetical protein